MSLSIDDLPSKTITTKYGVMTVRALERDRISIGGDLLTVNNVPVRGRIFFKSTAETWTADRWVPDKGSSGSLWHCWDRSDRSAGTRDRELSSGARDKLNEFVIGLANTEGTVNPLMLAESGLTNALDELRDAIDKKDIAFRAAADAETAVTQAEAAVAEAKRIMAELYTGAPSTPSSTS